MTTQLLSNNLKAVLFPDTMQDDGNNVQKEKCCTIQHFSYRNERSRNDVGYPYGPANPMTMSFTVRLVEPEEGMVYHKKLTENDPTNFTILFNATFNDNQRLKTYDNALIVDGFVIDVEDDFSAGDKDTQMLIRVKLFVRSITYKGKSKDTLLEINS